MKINKLSRNLAIASLLTPVGVNALGIGEIQLNSALNQNFSAEIPLIASPGENTKNIRVKLASPAAFEKAGVERSYLLSTLRFKPELNADGTMSVKVLSNEAIREPFLNFLVEVKWAEGRMLKEYIVLLDPPGLIDQAVVTAQTAPQWQQDQANRPNNQPTPETIVTEEERLFGEQVDPEYDSESQATSKPATSTLGKGFSRSVVVPKGAILWTIAEKMRAETGGSQEQMLLALFRNNPDAFYQNNINALNAGALLKIPTLEMLESVSPEAGVQQVYEHNQRWNQKALARAKRQETVNQANKTATNTGQKTKTASAGQLKLAPAEGDIASAGDQVLLERLQTLLSQLELVTEENAILKGQIADLDSKIKKLSEAAIVPLGQIKPKDIVATASQTANTQISSTTADTVVKDVKQPKLQVGANKSTTVLKPPAVGDSKLKPVAKNANKPSTEVTKKSVSSVKPDSQPDSLMESPWAVGSVIGALSLGLIGWQMNRRRKLVLQEQMELNELNTDFDGKQAGVADKPGSVEAVDSELATKQDSELGDSIFFSEYRATESISDINSVEVDHNDLDPLSEADVYVAYGRYQQAEELIQQALDDHPDRDEYKLKLLEIHHAKDDSVGFTAYITQLREEGKTTNADFWARAKEIGNGFAPENLFGETQTDFEANQVEEFSSELFGIDSESESLELNDDLSAIFADKSVEVADDTDSATKSIDAGNDEGTEFALDELSTDTMDISLDESDNFSLSLTELDTTAETEQIDSENSIDFMLSEAEELNDKTLSEMNVDSEVDSISWDLDMDSEEAQIASDFPVDTISSNSVLLEADENGLPMAEMDTASSQDLEVDTNDSLGLFSSVELANDSFSVTEEMADDSFSLDLSSSKDESTLAGIDDLQLGQSETIQATEEFQLVIDGKNDDEQLFTDNDASTMLSLDDTSSELVVSAQISDLLDEVTEHNTEFVEENVISELFEPATLIQESELFESELSDLDEVADKLDLARVYIDMEDGESARGILNEVIELGTDEQKEIAKSMVQTIEKSA